MDWSINYCINWIKSEKERQVPYDIIYMGDLKYYANEFNYKTET